MEYAYTMYVWSLYFHLLQCINSVQQVINNLLLCFQHSNQQIHFLLIVYHEKTGNFENWNFFLSNVCKEKNFYVI